MMRGRVFAVVPVALWAAVVSAELTEAHRTFIDGPAGWIATKSEKATYRKLTTDAEAERFIELFWARRDPDLATAVNEFKVDFDLRVAAADTQYGSERGRGSMSDRGRTLIVMGRPYSITHQRPESMVDKIAGPEAEKRGGLEVWTYRAEQVPKSVKANEVYFIFAESRLGVNDYPLDRDARENARAMKLFADAPERLLLHPDLKEVPRVGLLRGSQVASEADLAVFLAEQKPWPEGALVAVSQGAQSATLLPLWVHVRVPAAVPAATRVVGRVTAGAGSAVESFVAPAKPLDVAGGRAYELSLPVGPGSCRLELALLGEAGAIAVTAVTAELEAAPEEATWISPAYWGVDVRQESLASPGDPFDVGGWHVIPQPDNRYRLSDSLGYFVMIARPGMSAAQQPAVETSLALFVGGKKVTETPPEPAQLSHVVGDLWMFGSNLPLGAFRAAGEYRIEITVRDTVSGVRRTTGIPLTIGAS